MPASKTKNKPKANLKPKAAKPTTKAKPKGK